MARKNQIFHVSYIEYFQFLVKKEKKKDSWLDE